MAQWLISVLTDKDNLGLALLSVLVFWVAIHLIERLMWHRDK